LGFYKRNRSLFLVLLGTGLMATSVCWEYVRMAPDYRYIVSPWSMRGYETTQGWVILAGSLAALALAIPLSVRWLKGKLLESIIVTALVTAFAAAIPAWSQAPDRRLGGFAVWGLAVLLGLAALAVVGRFLPATMPGAWRKLALFGVFAAITVLFGLLVYDTLLGDRSVPLWVVTLIFMLTLDILFLVRPPTELVAYRLLLLGVTLTWLVSLVSPGALRSTLLGEQGIEGVLLRDVQITSGVLIAWAGGLLAFCGAVALWARRRDEIAEHGRAGQQLAVAAISAAELEEAV
jgi:hypothetical protein